MSPLPAFSQSSTDGFNGRFGDSLNGLAQAARLPGGREGAFLRHPADDHTLSIFDKAIQGKTDQYALKFVKPARRS